VNRKDSQSLWGGDGKSDLTGAGVVAGVDALLQWNINAALMDGDICNEGGARRNLRGPRSGEYGGPGEVSRWGRASRAFEARYTPCTPNQSLPTMTDSCTSAAG
jgi:hypothetical protein